MAFVTAYVDTKIMNNVHMSISLYYRYHIYMALSNFHISFTEVPATSAPASSLLSSEWNDPPPFSEALIE